MKPLLERLLDYYRISEQDYARLTAPITIDNFALNHRFDNMESCVALLREALDQNKKIFIYGDYDADGILSISILVKMFDEINYPISYHVPNRYVDGYGLNKKRAEEIVNGGYDLIITVDNGLTAFEGISYAKEHGLKVLIIDHHQPDVTLPDADGILHPSISNFGEIPTSAGFITFMFATAFLGRFDPYLSVLAAISVISDMMPLKEYNRNLVKLVIENYRENLFLSIDLLKEKDLFNEWSIGMRIAPKINAIGRLIDDDESLRKIIEFLTSDDPELLLNYNKGINFVNDERKDLTKNASENSKETIDVSGAAIVEIVPEKEGVIGLIANSFVKKYQKPTLIFALDQSGEFYKGSGRAPKGFNVVDAFKKLDYLLETSGGHSMAGGCTIKKEKYREFKSKFIALAAETKIVKKKEDVIPLYINEITFDNFDLINSLSPFGESWPAPKFILSHIRVASLMYSRDGQHIITSIGNNAKINGFYFSKEKMAEYQYVDLIGTLRLSNFYSKNTVEFVISEIFDSEKK
ncbi:MAG TPA: hypothetical protein GX010_00880 [Erysipelotrichaceae bacterium]|nr:hypothetical protein [Erysipelotrichaceae bacterium]